MKILYLSMSFDENKKNLYNDLVDELIENGHSVTVVRSDSSIKKNRYRQINENFNILDVKTGNPFVTNLFFKGYNQIKLNSFFIKAIKQFILDYKFDLIIYASPPITLFKCIKFCKKHFNATTFLMLKDIFPQNAVDLEMFRKNGIIYKYFRKQEIKYYNVSDYIGCMSQGNRDYLIEHNDFIDKKKIIIFPNTIKITNDEYTKFNEECTTFVFGGNIGKPQNLRFILSVFEKLVNYPKAKLLIIGTGTEESIISNAIREKNLLNVEFKKFVPRNQYDCILKETDVGLISLDYRFTIPNIPSKLLSYLHQKKPVLAVTDEVTDIKRMILDNECGWWCSSNKVDDVVKTIIEICENKDKQKKFGINGYKFLVKEFDVKKSVAIFESLWRDDSESI